MGIKDIFRRKGKRSDRVVEIDKHEVQKEQTSQNVPWLQDIELWIDSPDQEPITFENSQELREANELALNESSIEEGIQKLRNIVQKHPDCSSPNCLLAYALRQQKRVAEAEKLLLEAFPKVLKKSDLGNSLGILYFFDLGNLEKSTEWFVKSILAERPETRSNWGSYLYLSGIYNSYGLQQEASQLKKLADQIRGHPASLSYEWNQKLGNMKSKASQQSITSILKETWNSAIKIELEKIPCRRP